MVIPPGLHLVAYAEELRREHPEWPVEYAVFEAERTWPYKAVSVELRNLREAIEVVFAPLLRLLGRLLNRVNPS